MFQLSLFLLPLLLLTLGAVVILLLLISSAYFLWSSLVLIDSLGRLTNLKTFLCSSSVPLRHMLTVRAPLYKISFPTFLATAEREREQIIEKALVVCYENYYFIFNQDTIPFMFLSGILTITKYLCLQRISCNIQALYSLLFWVETKRTLSICCKKRQSSIGKGECVGGRSIIDWQCDVSLTRAIVSSCKERDVPFFL